MKDKNFDTQEFEKLLRDKMNELSDSVDCFDKISARAFPKDFLDFSSGEFIVSDLENVTGRKSRLPWLKWAALGAAAALCLAVIPKTGLTDRLFANLGDSSGKDRFRKLCTEISELDERDDQLFFDVPLSVYSQLDVLITPGACCPFEFSGEDKSMVRVFVRTVCGGVPTNQFYAVEYEGTYSEENIIAAAATEVSISREEAARVEESKPVFTYDDPLLTETVRDHFTASGSGALLDAEGNDTVAASYAHPCFFKDENGIRPVTMTVLYGRRNSTTDDSYFYDICASFSNGNSFIKQNDVWEYSLYYNGTSAKPEKDQSLFSYTPLFGNNTSNDENSWAYVIPFSAVNGRVSVKGHADKIMTDLVTVTHGSYYAAISSPLSDSDALSMRLFFDPSMLFDSSGELEIFSSAMSSPAVFDIKDVIASDDVIAKVDMDIQNDELQRNIAEEQAKAEEAVQRASAEIATTAGDDIRYNINENVQQRISDEQRKIEEHIAEMPAQN